MRLLVFDFDGTLAATDEVDTKCFIEAFADAGFDEIDADWGNYEHTTDAGIAAEIFAAALGRLPSDQFGAQPTHRQEWTSRSRKHA